MRLSNIAYKNIRGNISSYSSFFLATAFSVMVFFVFAMLIYNPGVDANMQKMGMQRGTIAVEVIIYLFLAFFISYTLITYTKKRSRDYAIFRITGIGFWQLTKLFFIENFLIFFSSVITGIVTGMVFSKLFFMVIASILNESIFDVYFPWQAFALTIGAFLALFLILNVICLVLIHKVRLVKILKMSRESQKKPKLSILKAILGFALIATGYYLAFTANNDNLGTRFFPVLGIVIVGTYFFYNQFSVLAVSLLKRNKKFYYKGTNALWVSDLAYRLKDCSRVLFFTTIVLAVGLTSFSSIYTMVSAQKESLLMDKSYPLIISEYNAESKDAVQKVDSLFAAEKMDVMKYTVKVCRAKKNYKTWFFSNASYLKMNEKLKSSFKYSEIKFIDDLAFNALSEKDYYFMSLNIYDYEDVTALGKELNAIRYDYYSQKYKRNTMFDSTGAMNYGNFGMMKYALFLSFFVGLVFLVSVASMLYFKFFNHLQEDGRKYQNIAKIGLSKAEIVSSARIQMAILFFVPVLLAIAHATFAIKALGNLSTITVVKPLCVVIAWVLVIQFVYFILINRRYNKSLLSYLK